MFIAFEGLDGSGSSTQAAMLYKYFLSKGKKALLTKEPTTGTIGKMVRDVLQHKIEVPGDALQLLFCADRADHLHTKVNPALERGEIVISDRYYFSTIAFGTLSNDRAWLEELNKNFRKPDIIFLFKLEPSECIKRIESRGNEKELFEKEETLKMVWETYKYLSTKHENCIVIDASRSIEEIAEKIISYINI